MTSKIIFFFIGVFGFQSINAQLNQDSSEKWHLHFQVTGISQSHSGFNAKYSGPNSLISSRENGKLSLTSTLFTGLKLSARTAFYADMEIAGGQGLSAAKGIAGFTNGETFRISTTAPVLYMARYYLKHVIPLGHTEYNQVESDQHQLASKIPDRRIEIMFGKGCLSDYFDLNSYSHDPRTQFMNWSLMSNAAWDYPADTRGYTKGLVLGLFLPLWELRFSSTMVPAKANGLKLDSKITKAHSEAIEYTRYFNTSKTTIVRLLAFRTNSQAPTYEYAIQQGLLGDTVPEQVISGQYEWKRYGGLKYGIAANMETKLSATIGYFAKASWNDGKSATWAFTEIDNSVSMGVLIDGTNWKRKNDRLGFAIVSNGISSDHQLYLKNGNLGFMIGDGNLNYRREAILESFYSAKLNQFLAASLDYQYVVNPGYNKDRGRVHVWAIRGHIAL